MLHNFTFQRYICELFLLYFDMQAYDMSKNLKIFAYLVLGKL